jgi:thiol-disulfide isomerase/thioredoxin
MMKFRHVFRVSAAGFLVGWCAGMLSAADERARTDREAGGFQSILDRQNRQSLRAVADYLTQHPEATDAEQAYLWLFETAVNHGLEGEIVALADAFNQRKDLDPATRSIGQQALAIGLARAGKLQEAVTLFETHLRGIRFQPPGRTVDFAQSLATQARLAGDWAAARAIYERLSSAFPLNPQVSEIAEGKIARLELIGKPVPRIAADDLEQKRVDLADYSGKVVLVDFWATNCPPCLAEFPNLRQLHQEYRPKGFEIIGISFDESPDLVESFRTRAKLPWRMAMNDAPEGRVSERYKAKTIPALYLVDKKGNVAQVDVRGKDLRAVIEKLLAE